MSMRYRSSHRLHRLGHVWDTASIVALFKLLSYYRGTELHGMYSHIVHT